MGETVHHPRNQRKRKPLWLIPVAVIAAIAVVGVSVTLAARSPAGSGSALSSGGPVPVARMLPKSFIDRNTSSPYVILGDITNGRVLYSKNADERCYPASTTKLVTALVAVEYAAADTEFTVGNEIYMIDSDSSRAYLTVGTRLTLENLLQATLLPSGNDAAYVLAANVGRMISGNAQQDNAAAIQTFCGKMNEKAQQLGCTGTHFCNPDGVHSPDHYTTAADMLKIATAVLGQELIARTVSQPEVTVTLLSGQTVTWKNSNRLVRQNNAFSFAGATGMKTGSTDEAGYCLVASATRDGNTSVAVVMGAKEENGRWEDASGLLDISFQ